MSEEKVSCPKIVEEIKTEDSQHNMAEKFTQDTNQEQMEEMRIIQEEFSKKMREGILAPFEESKKKMIEGINSDLMEEILAPLKKLSFEYSRDPVGVTERELSYLTNFPELPTVEISDNLQSVFDSIDHDVAIEQRDLTREIHFSMMQMAELTKKMADMSEIAAESAEKTTKLTLLIYILTGASIIIGLTGLAINSATAIFSENPESLTSAVLTCWIGGSIATLIVIGSMLFTFKRKKTPKSKITKSNSASEPPKTP